MLRKPVVWLTAGAVALRLTLLLGRGDYVAYDEAWYLLLGHNLLTGNGYTLSGLQHVALSPLFPILAAALGLMLDSLVWGGRIVAAVGSGLLVIPCWSIFRRMAGRQTALLACGLVAVMPSLAPFVVAWWVGWDLWVGAEPVLHLCLYSGIALFLRARERGGPGDWLLAGVAFGLAYLARPEAIIPFGILALVAAVTAAVRRAPRLALRAAPFGVAFLVVATPYWLYLHDALGRWALTGRGVPALTTGGPAGPARGSARSIERMLWMDDEAPYLATLYALDASGTGLASTYWGVAPRHRETPRDLPPAASTSEAASDALSVPGASGPEAEELAPPSPVALYGRTMQVLLPWYLLPLLVVGLLAPGRERWRREVAVAGPLMVTSLLIAVMIAVDPRTQLFLVPLLAFYIARGIGVLGVAVDRRLRPTGIRRRFSERLLAAVALLLLLGTDVRRLHLSLDVGSPHHIVAAQHREVGEVLRRLVPDGEPIMSWIPAIAIHARRDWRVLPHASFPDLVRYAEAVKCGYIVFSVYAPSPLSLEQMPREYLIVRPTPEAAGADQWHIEVTETGEHYAVGWLKPA